MSQNTTTATTLDDLIQGYMENCLDRIESSLVFKENRAYLVSNNPKAFVVSVLLPPTKATSKEGRAPAIFPRQETFIQIARIINGATIYGNPAFLAKQQLAENIAKYLKETVPGFNPDKFIEACQIGK